MNPATATVLLAALLFLPGCSYYDKDPGPDAGGHGFCLSHSDCAEEERCINKRCHTDPPPCGEEVAPECHWGLEQEECHQKRGSWQCSYVVPDYCWCDCPTGQEGCPCWSAAHCQGDCMAEGDPMTFEECENTKMGTCSARSTNLGCWCRTYYDRPGFNYICSD